MPLIVLTFPLPSLNCRFFKGSGWAELSSRSIPKLKKKIQVPCTVMRMKTVATAPPARTQTAAKLLLRNVKRAKRLAYSVSDSFFLFMVLVAMQR